MGVESTNCMYRTVGSMDPGSGIVISIYSVQHVAAWSSELGLGFLFGIGSTKGSTQIAGPIYWHKALSC